MLKGNDYGLSSDLTRSEDFLLSPPGPMEDFLACSTLACLSPILTSTSSSNFKERCHLNPEFANVYVYVSP